MSRDHVAMLCGILALPSGLVGAFCWLKDPFFTSEGIGSGISFLAGCAAVSLSFLFVNVGLTLKRRIRTMLVLVNVTVFVLAAVFLVRGEYIVYDDDAVANFFSRTHWELVFAVLSLSAALTLALYKFLRR